MKKVIALALSGDGNATDEIYAFVGSVAINQEKPWTSTGWATATNIMENMDAGSFRSLSVPVWGAADGSPVALRKPTDAVMLFSLIESDGAVNPFIAKELIRGKLIQAAATLNPDQTYAARYDVAARAFVSGINSVDTFASGDDLIVNSSIAFSQSEIDAARAGKVVKKEVTVGQGSLGVYTLRFQMGRLGVSQEVW